MAALSGEDRARAGRHRSACSAQTSAAHRRAGGARAGPALRARGAARPRRGADAVAGAEHAAHAHARRSARGGWIRTRRARGARAATSSSASTSRPAARTRRRESLSGGNLQKFIVGREIDAAPEAADRLAADLGRRRRRRGADPRRDARAARRRLRGAGRQRGARRAVRDLRPPGRDRPRPRLAARSPAARRRVEQIGEWMSGLWHDAPSAPRRRGHA